MLNGFHDTKTNAIAIHLLREADFSNWQEEQSSRINNWCEQHHFTAKPKQFCVLPAEDGSIESILVGDDGDFWAHADLATRLPPLQYFFTNIDENRLLDLLFTWGMHCYRFDNYKKCQEEIAEIFVPNELRERLNSVLKSHFLVRDLITTPAMDFPPSALADAAKNLADAYQADVKVTQDQALVENFPAIYTVGKGSSRPPCFIELTWGNPSDPLLTLVGKGIVFDTGGYNLKPGNAMRYMKKDMGGAAHVLGLARMIMQEKLPVRLQVLISAAENSVSGDAYRPGDVITTRSGKTVEIDNTDAEGRLVMADALTYANESSPDLIIDISTLTGAARVALGLDVPVFFANQESMEDDLKRMSKQVNDLVWPLPLYKPYFKMLDSSIADMENSGDSPFGGAITAALFLEEFVAQTPWIHFDLNAFNLSSRPGRPKGGEALALRALYAFLAARYN